MKEWSLAGAIITIAVIVAALLITDYLRRAREV